MKLFSSRPKWPPFHLNTLVHGAWLREKGLCPKSGYREVPRDPARSQTPCTYRSTSHGNREIRVSPRRNSFGDASGKSKDASEKTRLLEFGPYAIDQRQWRGEGKPETFNFLGFTHICVKKRSNGRFTCCGRRSAKVANETEGGENRTSEADARTHPRVGKWLPRVGLPLSPTASASRSEALTRAVYPARTFPVNASTPPSRAAPHDSGVGMGRYPLYRMTLLFTTPRRFIRRTGETPMNAEEGGCLKKSFRTS